MNKIHKTGRTWQTPFGAPMLAILITLFTWGSANAQVASYGFASTSGTYTPITGGTVVVVGATTPASNDVNYVTQTIGFPFTFSGASYTTFGISSNGYIWFGTGSPLTTNYNPISSASANLGGTGTIDGIVSALGRDILKRTATPFGELRVETTGTTPSRVCVVQFTNWRGFAIGTSAVYNFQIRLLETSNTVEVVYGTFITTGVTATSDFQIGLRGVSNTDFNNRSILATNTWATSTTGIANTASATISTILSPTSGQTYTWTPPPPCSGTPTAGTTNASLMSVCSGTPVSLSLVGATAATGLTYVWESSPTGVTWTPIGVTTSSAGINPISTLQYRCQVSCGVASATSTPVMVTVSSATYASIPVVESFETTWQTSCAVAPFGEDAVNASWRTSPTSGNNSWRADNTTAILSGWDGTGGGYTPVSSVGARSAKFHSFHAPVGAQGALDLYIDLSNVGTKRLSFDFINPTGTDVLELFLSTDGGQTFSPLTSTPAALGVTTAWTNVTADITSTSATAVIRFRCTSDFGDDDIGVDNVSVALPCAGAPTAGVASPANSAVCRSTTISLTGATVGLGISYLWESSTTSATTGFSPIPTATTSSYVAPIPTVTTYYRCVVTCANGGATATSSVTTLTVFSGITTFPYNENFDATPGIPTAYTPLPTNTPTNGALPCSWTVDNVNGDVSTWYSFAPSLATAVSTIPNALIYRYNADGVTAANDWVFTSPLTLTAGNSYTVSFKARASDAPTFVEAMEVRWGTAATVAAMLPANIIYDNTNINSTTFATFTATVIVPPTTGVYYIGLYAKSIPDRGLLYIDDFQITETAAAPTCSVLTVGTNTVPAGTVGSAYTFNGAVTSAPVTTAITYTISPALTNGLMLDAVTGEISSASITGTANTTVYVISALQTTPTTCTAVTRSVSIVISAAPTTCSVLTVGTNAVPAGTVGSAYTFSGAVTSAPVTTAITYTISPALTNGLMLDAVTGEISSASITGTANTTVYVISALQTTPTTCTAVTRSVSIVISAAPATCSVLTVGTNTVPSGTVGSAYTFSGAVTSAPVTTAITYTISPALTNGLMLDAVTGEISSASITGVANTTVYVISALQTTPTTCTAVTRSVSIVISAAPATCSVLTVGTNAVPAGTVGSAYTFSGAVTSAPVTTAITYTISPALTNGLMLDAVTGEISSASITGVANTTVYVISALQTTPTTCTAVTRSISIVISAAATCPATVTFTPATLPGATVGVAYNSGAITATNLTGTVTYSSTTLPAGFAINSVTGAITAPATAITAATTLNGIIVVANTTTPLVCTGSSAPYSIVVTAAPLCPTLPTLTLAPAAASASTLVSGTVGVPFSQTFTAGGIAGATYTYALTAGVVLPAGLSFASTSTSATISGNPSAATSVTVVVRATSNGGCVSPATSYTLVINPSPTTAIDNSLANLVKVSPNPSKGDFNVDFGTINMTKSSVRVYDAQGKVVFTSENNTSTSGNLMTISLDKFANGIYLMEVETSKGRILKRLAKQ